MCVNSKTFIDEIDSVLAKYYGFTDEALDFIINHAIKYRMGRGERGGRLNSEIKSCLHDIIQERRTKLWKTRN